MEQTNFVNEANNILYFERFYRDNEYIIIPEVYKISETILIMSHESGTNIDNPELNDYKRNKIVNLYHLFIRENQMINNYNHGDLHPGNWRARIEGDKSKIVIYDFGFCWKQNQSQFIEMGDLMTDTFESSNRETNEVSLYNLCTIMYYAVLYDGEDKEGEYKDRIRNFTNKRLKDLEPWKLSPIVLLKAIIEFCQIYNLLIDPTLLQGFIVIIQGQKLFEMYELMASDNNLMDDYKVFRERYLNIYTFCKTYNIFPGYSKYIEDKLNKKQVEIGGIFDTIDYNDIDLENMALGK
jgi:predicted unusual protein kinase regulating ubiquinone biosynthesis (AarF/ABC1/UbiB family)